MKIAFVWDHFGPMHIDRCRAVAESGEHKVVGIEVGSISGDYGWASADEFPFSKLTLFKRRSMRDISWFRIACSLVKSVVQSRADAVFMSHYDHPAFFLSAAVLRVSGYRVFTMGCSKFDDKPRSVMREFLKSAFLRPYNGALVGSPRSASYYRYLGCSRIALGANSLSTNRIREQSEIRTTKFTDRPFVAVARLIPKKNLECLINAFAMFSATDNGCRRLEILGSGPLECELRKCVDGLGITHLVSFRGFVQTETVTSALSEALALVLVSIEEQFGNVVIEANSLGVPSIVSDVCGAHDEHLRTFVSGFLVEPDNARGIARAMATLAESEDLWANMSAEALRMSQLGDVARFSQGVEALIAAKTPLTSIVDLPQ